MFVILPELFPTLGGSAQVKVQSSLGWLSIFCVWNMLPAKVCRMSDLGLFKETISYLFRMSFNAQLIFIYFTYFIYFVHSIVFYFCFFCLTWNCVWVWISVRGRWPWKKKKSSGPIWTFIVFFLNFLWNHINVTESRTQWHMSQSVVANAAWLLTWQTFAIFCFRR